MASIDDVSQGFADAWDDFVDGKLSPEAFLRRKMGSTSAADRAKFMGKRLAAEKFASLKKLTGA